MTKAKVYPFVVGLFLGSLFTFCYYSYQAFSHKTVQFTQNIYSTQVPAYKDILKTCPNCTKKTIKVKVVDLWMNEPTNENPWWPFYDVLSSIYNLNYTENPDFVFYSQPPRKSRQYKNAVKIYLSGENTMPNFNYCDYAITYNPIKFEDRHFWYAAYMYSEILFGPWEYHPITDRNMAKRNFCSFVVSSGTKGLEGTALRMDFFQLLSKYKHIDSPGKIFNNMKMPTTPRPKEKGKEHLEQWRLDKLNFIKDRKFVIAFENSNSYGYTTEKLTDALRMHTIPIYFGNPTVGLEYNKKAFIHVNDYNSLEEVVQKVIELDNDDDAYMAMLNEPPFVGMKHRSLDELRDFFVNIIEKGNKPFKKDPQGISEK